METHRSLLSPVQVPPKPSPLAVSAPTPSARSRHPKLPLPLALSPSPSRNLVNRPDQRLAQQTSAARVLPLRKPRPATAVPSTSSSTMIHELIAAHAVDSHPELSDDFDTSKRRTHPTPHRAAPGEDPVVQVLTRHAQRCIGCGAYAELCMSCLSQLKRQDGAAYKQQVARSVEMLFERATRRAFTKMTHVILTWIFGTWKRETQLQTRRRALAVRSVHTRRLQRLWRAWHTFIYERRIVGAMLFAQQQHHFTHAKNREIAQLHGDMYERDSDARLRHELQGDAIQQLQLQLETQQRSMQNKNAELLTLRKQLHDARERIARLEKQAIDPKELERIRAENIDAKKMVFQLAATTLQGMESDLEMLSTSEGRQNLNGVLSKDLVLLLDKPEHPGFYNPLVELANTVADTGNPLATFDAPVDRADRVLLQWVNFLVQKQQAQAPDWLQTPRVVNFHASLSDGKAWTLLTKTLHAAMCRVRPKRPPGAVPSKLESASVLRDNGEDLTEIAMERYVDHVRREEAPPKRLELMIGTIGQALWMPRGLLSVPDILAGDAEINFATLTYLFCTFSPTLDDTHYALCNDLKGQLSSAKAKWRELRDAAFGVTTTVSTVASGGSNATMVAQAAAGYERGGGGVLGTGLDDVALVSKLKLVVAQTLELKKRLDVEDSKAREGHSLWWKSTRIVLRKCFLSYARLARGKSGVLSKLEASQDENEAFSKIPKTKLADLEQPFEDFAWEVKLLQSFLTSVYCDLARIYRGYAMRSDPTNEFVTVADLTELLVECRVIDNVILTSQDVHNIIRKVDPRLTGTINTTRIVTPAEYLEVLVRTARRKYSGEHHRMTLSEAFCLLVDNFILPFAFRADADVFRKQIEDPKIRRLLLKFTDDLRDIYASYAVEDSRRRPRKRPRMTAFTFSQCLLDRNVQDVTFNSEKVMSIVQRVARAAKKEIELTPSVGSANGGVPALTLAEEDELTFEEFEEAMIVTACYKFPDPYISLESRLEKFLTFYVRGNGTKVS